MNSKRIFILAYTKQNLGDDLFIKMVIERYNANFYLPTAVKYKKKTENLIVILHCIKQKYRND